MKDNTSISIETLRAISSSLEAAKDMIYNEYKSQIVPILDSTASCFSVAGVNIVDIEKIFSDTFNDLKNRYEALLDILNNKVILGYSNVIDVIKKLFNEQLSTELFAMLKDNYGGKILDGKPWKTLPNDGGIGDTIPTPEPVKPISAEK